MNFYLAIFALLVVFYDATGKFFTTSVQVSPANPVQFWSVDCQTFNQKQVCGIFHRCWDSPWQCDDEIKNQFYDSISDDVNFGTITDLPPLSEWKTTSLDSKPDWSLGATPSVSLPSVASPFGISSEILYFDTYYFVPGFKYRITVNYTGNAVGSMTAGIYNSDFERLSFESALVINGTRNITLEFAATSETAIFGIVGATGQLNALNITVNTRSGERSIPDEYVLQVLDENGNEIDQLELSTTIIEGTFDSIVVYYNSFVPSDLNVCDEKIYLKLLKLTGSPDEEILISDPLDIRVSQPCTNLIEYSSNRNYAGLFYDGLSPSITFNIRVKSVFYDEELPQEDFVMDLPQGVEKTGSVLTSQRLLKIHKVPEHQHKKIVLVLNHQFVLIDGSYWTKAEKYEKIQKSNERQPMRNAQVLLTQRDFLVRSNL